MILKWDMLLIQKVLYLIEGNYYPVIADNA